MTTRLWLCASAVLLASDLGARAQIVVVNPPPVFGPVFAPVPVAPAVPVLIPNGIGFRYRSGNLAVGGFFGTGASVGALYPVVPVVPFVPGPPPPVLLVPQYSVLPTYGVVNSRVTVQIIAPTIQLVAPSAAPDLSGVDLDVTPPPWAPKRAAAPPKLGPGDAVARAPEKKIAPPAPEIKIPPVPPKIDPGRDARVLLQAGVRAFRDNEIGLATQRFRQALDLDPKLHEGHFYLAQALISVGKYNDAFDRIAQGLKLRPDWPREKFKPRIDLYGLHIEEWQKHVKALETAQKADAKNGNLMFLVGYLHWFNGNQPEAFDFLRRARPLLADPAPAQRFLDVAPIVVKR